MSVVETDAIRVEMIPGELRDRQCWVVWRSIEEGGRIVKPPFDPHTGELELGDADAEQFTKPEAMASDVNERELCLNSW